jgi:FkbM family methyltransferase
MSVYGWAGRSPNSGLEKTELDAKALTEDGNLVVLVDVGGLGGIQPEWDTVAGRVLPILFEPNPAEAAPLRERIAKYGNGKGLVIQKGLAAVRGPRTLRITKSVSCSTMQIPDQEVLSGYSIGPAFDVTATQVVECSRYDVLYKIGEVPKPDVVKVDVQGLEYEVLLGFGELLGDCLGIQLEAQIYPIYQHQRLLGDIIELLSHFGLVLRKIVPSKHFDGDFVELDAWFTIDKLRESKLDTIQREKFQLIHHVWQLPNRQAVFGEGFFNRQA